MNPGHLAASPQSEPPGTARAEPTGQVQAPAAASGAVSAPAAPGRARWGPRPHLPPTPTGQGARACLPPHPGCTLLPQAAWPCPALPCPASAWPEGAWRATGLVLPLCRPESPLQQKDPVKTLPDGVPPLLLDVPPHPPLRLQQTKSQDLSVAYEICDLRPYTPPPFFSQFQPLRPPSCSFHRHIPASG